MVEALLQVGTDVHASDVGGNTALILATEQGWQNIVRALVRADTGAKSSQRKATLMISAEKRCIDLMWSLFQAGEDARGKNCEGKNGPDARC